MLFRQDNRLASAILTALVGALAGCASGHENAGPPADITVDYDPSAAGPAPADAEARARCGAYGLTAAFVDETEDPSGRLRHRHFVCE